MKKILFSLLIILLITGCGKSEVKKMDVIENKIKVIINNKEYDVDLFDNITVKEFLKELPTEYLMKELNGNEKYYFLDNSLPTVVEDVGHINKGDVMLYKDNCLVIFYESFDTPYQYTKIGHINNLDALSNNDVLVKWSLK